MDQHFHLPQQQQQLLVLLLIQQRALATVVDKLGFTGKGQLIVALRAAIAVLMTRLEQDL